MGREIRPIFFNKNFIFQQKQSMFFCFWNVIKTYRRLLKLNCIINFRQTLEKNQFVLNFLASYWPPTSEKYVTPFKFYFFAVWGGGGGLIRHKIVLEQGLISEPKFFLFFLTFKKKKKHTPSPNALWGGGGISHCVTCPK